MDISPFKLPDAEFWAGNERGSDAIARELVGEHQGVLVDAPSRVDIAHHSTLPIGIYHLGSIRSVAATRLDRFGVVTAMDLWDNRLFAVSGRELEQDTDTIEPAPRDVMALPEGDMSTTYAVELRSLLSIPWKQGRYLITILLRDAVSNRAAVELVGGVRGTPEMLSVWPPSQVNLATYLPHPNSPELPAAFGIALRPTRVVDLRKAWQWPIYGAFRLRHSEQVRSGDGTTVVAVHLLLSGADDGSMDTISIGVPCRGDSGGTLMGHFNLDLMPLTLLRAPQTYFITAFSGDVMTAPVPSALVAPWF